MLNSSLDGVRNTFDYGLTIQGNVKDSTMETAADHDAKLLGGIENSTIYKYGSKEAGKQKNIFHDLSNSG